MGTEARGTVGRESSNKRMLGTKNGTTSGRRRTTDRRLPAATTVGTMMVRTTGVMIETMPGTMMDGMTTRATMTEATMTEAATMVTMTEREG